MWCKDIGGPNCYWTEKEAEGLRFIRNKVLELGWESRIWYNDGEKFKEK